jgi:protein-L-isoaspartate O-methyltransferase
VTRYKRETGPEKLAAAALAAGVADPLVLDAVRHTPRAAFVPAAYATGRTTTRRCRFPAIR